MNSNKLVFTVLFLPFIISCAHYETIVLRNELYTEGLRFKDYFIRIPQSSDWLCSNYDLNSQSIFIVSPNWLNIKSNTIKKDGKPVALVLEPLKQSMVHPNFAEYYNAYIDLYYNLVSQEYRNYADSIILELYKQDDFNYNISNNIVDKNTSIELSTLTIDSTVVYKLSEFKANAVFPFLCVAMSVYESHGNRFIITAKLWRKEIKSSDLAYLTNILRSIKPY